MLAIGLAVAPGLARLCQTLVAGVAGLEYVAAARIAGVNRFRIMGRHVLPNVAEPLIVNVTITAGAILLSFAGLSFLGLGVQAPEYDWGRLMQDGLSGIFVHPLAALAPGPHGGPRRSRLQPHRRGDRRGVRDLRDDGHRHAAGADRRDARDRPSTTTTRPTATWCSTYATSRSPSRA